MANRARFDEPSSTQPSIEAVDEVLDALHQLLRASYQQLGEIAARHELTAEQAKLVRSLTEPRSMGAIARDRSCDASNVTGLIDRIERLRLVERTSDPLDRRIRLLSLTAAGRKVRASIERELAAQPSPLAALDAHQFAELHAILQVVAPTTTTDPA